MEVLCETAEPPLSLFLVLAPPPEPEAEGAKPEEDDRRGLGDGLHKWFYTLAAFHPEVKQRLEESGLLMPTIQMIFRRSRVASDAEYLSGRAHPSVFGNSANRSAMETMARGIELGDIPPMVRLSVVEDSYTGVRSRDFFEFLGTEVQYDTPV